LSPFGNFSPFYALAPFLHRLVPFACGFKHLHYLHMENHTFGKLWHLDLCRYLGLIPTLRQEGTNTTTDVPSGPRPCCPRIPSFVFRPNHRLHLVQGLSVPMLMPWAPFFKPWLVDTHAACEYVKPWVKSNPTFRFVNQVHHGGHPMVVQTWALTTRAYTLEGPPRRACHSPPL
jgi:hypothetical protein